MGGYDVLVKGVYSSPSSSISTVHMWVLMETKFSKISTEPVHLLSLPLLLVFILFVLMLYQLADKNMFLLFVLILNFILVLMLKIMIQLLSQKNFPHWKSSYENLKTQRSQ